LAITKARKEELVAQYLELIDQSKAIFMTEYTGMSVKGMEALRRTVREANGSFHVTKKTLLKLALEQSGKPVPEDLMDGQLAAGFAIEEVPSFAKALVNFAKDEESLTLKGGIFNNEILSLDQVKALADRPYTVVCGQDALTDGTVVYMARVVELDCLTHGDTPAERDAMIIDVKREMVHHLIETGHRVPDPQPLPTRCRVNFQTLEFEVL